MIYYCLFVIISKYIVGWGVHRPLDSLKPSSNPASAISSPNPKRRKKRKRRPTSLTSPKSSPLNKFKTITSKFTKTGKRKILGRRKISPSHLRAKRKRRGS